VDARRTPKQIFYARPPDQRTYFYVDFGRPPRERDFQRQ
jgi:hypothetical protein